MAGVKQESAAPTAKVFYGGVAGAISFVVVWLLNTLKVLPGGAQIPGEVASALTTIFTFVVSYLVPPSASDRVVPAP
jgi:hypothetical protein